MNPKQKQELATFMRSKHYSERTIGIYIEYFNSITDEWNTEDPQLLYEHIKKLYVTLTKHRHAV